MAYNNYFPQFYPPTTALPQVQQTNNGITWVQGENAAKSYPVAMGQSILLMDSENPVMYIKSTDQSGMPLPLRVFDYVERKATPTSQPPIDRESQPPIDYVSQKEFEAFKEEIRTELKQTAPKSLPKTTAKEK